MFNHFALGKTIRMLEMAPISKQSLTWHAAKVRTPPKRERFALESCLEGRFWLVWRMASSHDICLFLASPKTKDPKSAGHCIKQTRAGWSFHIIPFYNLQTPLGKRLSTSVDGTYFWEVFKTRLNPVGWAVGHWLRSFPAIFELQGCEVLSTDRCGDAQGLLVVMMTTMIIIIIAIISIVITINYYDSSCEGTSFACFIVENSTRRPT